LLDDYHYAQRWDGGQLLALYQYDAAAARSSGLEYWLANPANGFLPQSAATVANYH
jgi:hypothetical protein